MAKFVDYLINNVSIISDKITIPEVSKHIDLIGKALYRKYYNKLIVLIIYYKMRSII